MSKKLLMASVLLVFGVQSAVCDNAKQDGQKRPVFCDAAFAQRGIKIPASDEKWRVREDCMNEAMKTCFGGNELFFEGESAFGAGGPFRLPRVTAQGGLMHALRMMALWQSKGMRAYSNEGNGQKDLDLEVLCKAYEACMLKKGGTPADF